MKLRTAKVPISYGKADTLSEQSSFPFTVIGQFSPGWKLIELWSQPVLVWIQPVLVWILPKRGTLGKLLNSLHSVSSSVKRGIAIPLNSHGCWEVKWVETRTWMWISLSIQKILAIVMNLDLASTYLSRLKSPTSPSPITQCFCQIRSPCLSLKERSQCW